MTSTILSASNFNSASLNANAATTSQLLQQTGYNVLNATAANATNIGSLVTNQTQLTTYGSLTGNNPTDYYTFNLSGTSMKASFTNITDTTGVRYQISNSAGQVVADNQGTTAQQTAFAQLTSAAGLTASSGKYTVQVSYAPLSQKSLAQSYVFQLYSGNSFSTSYETTTKTQQLASQTVPDDNTGVWADASAQSYTTNKYNQIEGSFSSAINIGWLYQNKTSLAVTSQVTSADNADYYTFDFQKGSAVKLAFNNSTSTANAASLRVQVYDATGTYLIADSQGTAAQKKAYASLTSSTGLNLQTGNYAVKVSYASGSSQINPQTYNLQLSSGTYYTALDTTTASAQTIQNAMLSGTYQGTYNPKTAVANYLDGGQNDGILSILS